jgi:NADPH2:quinone reductase
MDNLIVSGLYQMKPPLPFVCGTDAAGVVSAVGKDVTSFKPGDRVAAFNWTGAFAEQMVAKEHRTIGLPEPIDFKHGSAILHTYVTGLYALRDRAHIQPGETLVVHGASGGVGLATVDLGRHLGARVIGTVGSDEKAELVKSYGAEHVINYQTESIRDRVRELTDGRGADVIFDMVGGDVFDQSIRCINWNGRILIIGFTSGTIPKLPLNLPLLKNCSIVGVFMGLWADKFPDDNAKLCETLMQWIAAGELRPYVSNVMPLARAGEALQMLADRRVTGRIVLTQE